MLNLLSNRGAKFCDGLTRRDFLKAGTIAAGSVGLTLTDLSRLDAARTGKDINCILLFLVGGPSQLETFDLKPDAPDFIRGPFRPIRTSVPGIQICEHLPRTAGIADKFAIVRSVHHTSAPIHETGHQLMQTGRLFTNGQEYPHYGAVLSHLKGSAANGVPAFAVLPTTIENTGVSVSHGQTAGYLGKAHEPVCLTAAIDEAQRRYEFAAGNACSRLVGAKSKGAFDLRRESDNLRERYGWNQFGQSCLLARRLVESGVRLVTVNMFDTVFNQVTWDCHADGGSLGTTLSDYRDTLCPMFDAGYSSLLEDLESRGMFSTTLVLAMGEFGRTARLNPRGGRDHWPGCWSVLFAGAGIGGGQVVGSSDAWAAEPVDNPVDPAQIAATVFKALGLNPALKMAGPDGGMIRLADAEPIRELVG
jgi:Protein of unknown function (DUF1501)